MPSSLEPSDNSPGGQGPLDSALLAAGRLVLDFQRQGDRYAQQLRADGDAGLGLPPCLLAGSVEGDSEEIWPVSPPFQGLSIEKGEDGLLRAFLVGMAGKSHWSASIEPAPGASELSFDVACRAKEPPRELASRYAPGGDGHWELHHGQATLFLHDDRAILSVQACLPGTTLALDAPGWLVVASALPSVQRWPQTIRWGYRVRLEPAQG